MGTVPCKAVALARAAQIAAALVYTEQVAPERIVLVVDLVPGIARRRKTEVRLNVVGLSQSFLNVSFFQL